jgi:hypothetical protein
MDHNLKVLHPAVAKLWDLRKNQGKKPDRVRPGSKQVIWWRCLRNRRHVWRSRVSEAVGRPGCPHCGREPTPRPQRGENGPSYTGVRFSREAGLYIASLRRDGRRVELGGWKRARDAAIARDRAALFLEANVRLHFPGTSRKLGPASPEKLRRLARQSNQPKVTGAERFRGITRIRTGRWAVQLCVNNVVYTSSGYDSARAAAIAYDRLALHYAGPGWPRNFPARKLEPASFQELRRENVERRLRRRVNQVPKRTAFVGVYHRSDSQYLPWVALLPHSSVPPPSTSYYLGHYATAEEASRARDRAALYYVGRDAYLNHPDELDSLEPADAATLRAGARRAAQERKAARTKAVRAV